MLCHNDVLDQLTKITRVIVGHDSMMVEVMFSPRWLYACCNDILVEIIM